MCLSRKMIKDVLNVFQRFLVVIFTSYILVSAAHSAISLDQTYKPDAGKSFGNIVAMTQLNDGSIIAIDNSNGKLIKLLDNNASYTSITGSAKIFESESLGGLSFAGDNMLAVSNSGDNQFVIITSEGELVTRMGQSGSDAGEISNPHGIAYSVNRRIYIADTDNNRISVFGADGVYITTIGKQGLKEKHQLSEPVQVYVDSKERVYVYENVNEGQFAVFEHTGKLIKRFKHKQLKALLGTEPVFSVMAIDNTGLLYLADNENGRIYQIDWENNKILNAFGSKGDGKAQLNNISALLALNDGRIAVADSENNKVEIFKVPGQSRDSGERIYLPNVTRYLPVKMACRRAYRMNDGSALCLSTEQESVDLFSEKSKHIKKFASLSNPRAAAINNNKVVILDAEQIKVYSLDGEAEFEGKGYAGEGSGAGKLSSPEAVYLRHGKIYVADTGNQRVQIYSSDGVYLNKIENPEEYMTQLFSEPVSIVVDAQGNIIVADKDKKAFHVFSKENKHLYTIGGEKSKRPAFTEIYSLAIDADNNLYVLCATENTPYTIQVFNGPKKIMSFASKLNSDAGMALPTNLTVANSGKTLVGVYDEDKKRLLNFSYLQVPAKVGELNVVGGVNKTTISWTAVPGTFIKGYNVYGANGENAEFSFVTQVYENKVELEHAEKTANLFYKINAFSGLGSQGEFSHKQEDKFIKGYKLYQNKKYKQVVELFKPMLTENIEQPEMLKYIGLSLLEIHKLGDQAKELNALQAAVHAFREMSNMKGYEVEGLNLQIKALVAAEDYIAAKAIVDKVIEDKTAADNTYLFCGELSMKLGDPVGAITCLEEALQRDDKNIEAHFLMSDAYIGLGIVDKALQELDKVAELAPENADVWYRSGLIMLELKKSDEAIKQFEKVISLNKDHLNAQLALANAWLDKKEYTQVKSIAISLAGKKEVAAEGQYLLGLVAKAEGKNGEALLALIKATRLDKQHAAAWLTLADVYIAMEQKNKVRSTLESAVEADPKSFDAALRLGKMELHEKQYGAAIVQLSKAINIQQNNYAVKMLLADALYKSTDYKQALTQASEARKLKPDEIEPIVLLSVISNKQGKIGKAIDFMRQAMTKLPDSFDLTLGLGKLYSENNLFDQARSQLETAALLDASSYKPYVFLGGIFLKRRLFDQAIESFDKAVALEPTSENKLLLDKAYAQKKKSLEFKSNVPQIVLKDLQLKQIFSAAYKKYANKPVGKVRIQNTSGTDYGNLSLSFSIKGYMDFPTTKQIVTLAANETQEIDLLASFNNHILEIDEDTGVQVEVALKFVRDGKDDVIKLTQPVTIYGKNAILWSSTNMVGSFVTPKDDTLRDFVRQAINESKPEPGPLSDNLVTAMTLFGIYSAHGIRYVVDPNSPYSQIDNNRVDYVQFSRETLKIKSGDCDDLSVLMSSGLENLGVKTAILDVPGHLLMMFDSGLSIADKDQISLQENLMVEYEGNIWIPLEATMIGTSFSEAWAEGARKYYKFKEQNTLNKILLANAWQEYLPVTLKPANYAIDVPGEVRVKALVNREQNILMQKSLDRLVKPYKVIAAVNKGNTNAMMQVAIIYAKNGLYLEADKTFDEILKISPDNSAVHNNRGNIFYSRGEYERAVETYRYAEQLAANDPGVKVNMAMSYYQLGRLGDARTKFNEALTINQAMSEKYAGLSQLLSH
jgi:tetratricopeptide (TPR) repeat protein/DNA-binding beta-propeller fold protein YncE